MKVAFRGCRCGFFTTFARLLAYVGYFLENTHTTRNAYAERVYTLAIYSDSRQFYIPVLLTLLKRHKQLENLIESLPELQ